jgi:hypothetical protein
MVMTSSHKCRCTRCRGWRPPQIMDNFAQSRWHPGNALNPENALHACPLSLRPAAYLSLDRYLRL